MRVRESIYISALGASERAIDAINGCVRLVVGKIDDENRGAPYEPTRRGVRRILWSGRVFYVYIHAPARLPHVCAHVYVCIYVVRTLRSEGKRGRGGGSVFVSYPLFAI